MIWRLASWVVFFVSLARPLAAAPPPLITSDFQIDLFQGPILGSSRVVGLGGAYAAVAEESVGIPFNPASVGHRTYYSVDRFDWDVGLDFLIPGLFQGDDFDYDNNGHTASTDAYSWVVNGQIQYEAWGIGVIWRGQTFSVSESTSTTDRTYDLGLWLIQACFAYSFLDHQLILGGGVRVGRLQTRQRGQQELFALTTLGGDVGALYAPLRWPFRLAASFSSPLSREAPKECTEQQCPPGFVMPTGVALPWEVRIGAAYYLGAKPFNRMPPFMVEKPTSPLQPSASQPSASQPSASQPSASPPSGSQPSASPPSGSQPSASQPSGSQPAEKKPEKKRDFDRDYRGGRYVMISIELDIVGNVDDAIGLDGFIDQVRERSGEKICFSPHLGVESEVWRRRLRLRAGAYYEPTRFAESSGRFHGTFSFDLRLFDFSLLIERSVRVGAAIDVAARYSNVAFTVGFWH
jgi:hypothetical protein